VEGLIRTKALKWCAASPRYFEKWNRSCDHSYERMELARIINS